MIFFKQYSMMITFIVIAVWVMPAITSELAVLCTTLYETGRLITIYKDIPLEEDAIIGIFKRMTQWNIEQAASEQEKAVVIAVAKTLKVNFDITGSAIKRIENNKARLADKADGSVGTQKPPTVKDILKRTKVVNHIEYDYKFHIVHNIVLLITLLYYIHFYRCDC
uniref:ACYPI000223 protein n=1 Tax=Acyrthosiphon pisum TaxID=7029 RepID=C4WRR4_ACYPI|nr:ACYPI000223 [Acyrthosiphon pisum]